MYNIMYYLTFSVCSAGNVRPYIHDCACVYLISCCLDIANQGGLVTHIHVFEVLSTGHFVSPGQTAEQQLSASYQFTQYHFDSFKGSVGQLESKAHMCTT